MKTFLTILLILPVFVFAQSTEYDTTFNDGSGTASDDWDASVFLPDDYYENDSLHPLILVILGAGEIGNGPGSLDNYGPLAWRDGGWDGLTWLGNGPHKAIVVSLDPYTDFAKDGYRLANIITAIVGQYRVKPGCIAATGMSAGGYNFKILISEDAYDGTAPYGPFANADRIAALADFQGVDASGSTNNPGYWTDIRNFPRNQYGGQYLGVWDVLDGSRNIPRTVDSINAAVSGHARLFTTSLGHDADAWKAYYGYSDGTNPTSYTIDGVYQNVYQWLLRQMDTTRQAASDEPLLAHAGADIVTYQPDNSVTLTGAESTGMVSFSWSKLTGPTELTLTGNTSMNATASNLAIGVYTFELVVEDISSNEDRDTVTVTVYAQKSPDCNNDEPEKFALTVTSGAQIFYSNLSTSFPTLNGGDTLEIDYADPLTLLELRNFSGDSCRPIIIINKAGGQVELTGPIRLRDARFYEFARSEDQEYAFYVHNTGSNAGLLVTDQSSDGKHFYIKFDNVENAVFSKLDVDTTDALTYHPNWVFKNMEYAYLSINVTGGEAMYMNHTYTQGTAEGPIFPLSGNYWPVRNVNFLIHHVTIDSSGWDGIQISNSDSVSIYNNTITNAGVENLGSQQSGIVFGGYSTAKAAGGVYNNSITNSTGPGISVFGKGFIKIHSNSLDNCGAWQSNEQASIYINDNQLAIFGAPDEPLEIEVSNNCIQNVSAYTGGAAVRNTDGNNTTLPGEITGNTIFDVLGRTNSELIVTNAGDTITPNVLALCITPREIFTKPAGYRYKFIIRN